MAQSVVKKAAVRKDVRQLVLDAAIDLVASSGTTQLTMDAVAAHAGVSKGGLLHHFRSKTALLKAMVAEVVETFDDGLKLASGDPAASPTEAAPLSVYLERSFSGLGARMPTAQVVLAVQAYDPKLLAPLHDYFARRSKSLYAVYGEQFGAVLALLLIGDGLWIFDAIGAPPFKPADRKRALAAVLGWADTIQARNDKI